MPWQFLQSTTGNPNRVSPIVQMGMSLLFNKHTTSTRNYIANFDHIMLAIAYIHMKLSIVYFELVALAMSEM